MENKRNINERYNIILDKYNKISDIFNQLINNIDINEKNVNEDDTIILNDYINKTNGVTNEIEMLLNEIHEKYILQNKKMKKEEFEKYFNELNDKENSLDIKSINILEYRVNAEINNKMNQIYDELEEILDETLNSKNPLGIDSHVNYMYNFVKEKRKKLSKNKVEFDDKKEENINLKNDNNNDINKNKDENCVKLDNKNKNDRRNKLSIKKRLKKHFENINYCFTEIKQQSNNYKKNSLSNKSYINYVKKKPNEFKSFISKKKNIKIVNSFKTLVPKFKNNSFKTRKKNTIKYNLDKKFHKLIKINLAKNFNKNNKSKQKEFKSKIFYLQNKRLEKNKRKRRK